MIKEDRKSASGQGRAGTWGWRVNDAGGRGKRRGAVREESGRSHSISCDNSTYSFIFPFNI